MKAIIFDIRSFSVHDGPGIRTTFFFKGCPLRCAWCHNPESHQPGLQKLSGSRRLGKQTIPFTEEIGKIISLQHALNRAEADRLFYEDSKGGITLSGGEPLMQADFVKAFLDGARLAGIHTALDTSGFVHKSVFQEVTMGADLVLFDLKIMDAALHRKFTGKSNQLILDNFKWLIRQKTDFIIRIPLIKDITDTTENLQAIRDLLKQAKYIQRIDLLPYHQTACNKYDRLGLSYSLNHLPSYPIDKQQYVKEYFNDSAPLVTLGA
jgi:pyruvate formate lyase activating enzyme